MGILTYILCFKVIACLVASGRTFSNEQSKIFSPPAPLSSSRKGEGEQKIKDLFVSHGNLFFCFYCLCPVRLDCKLKEGRKEEKERTALTPLLECFDGNGVILLFIFPEFPN